LGRQWTFLLLTTFLSSFNDVGHAGYPRFRMPVLARKVGPE
jgi:hypothetical protein